MKSSPKTQRIIMVMVVIAVISGLLYVMSLSREKEGFAVSDWVGGSWLSNGCTKVDGNNSYQSSIMGKCGDTITTLNADQIKECPHYDKNWKVVGNKNAEYKYINLVRGPDDKLLCN